MTKSALTNRACTYKPQIRSVSRLFDSSYDLRRTVRRCHDAASTRLDNLMERKASKMLKAIEAATEQFSCVSNPDSEFHINRYALAMPSD